MSELLDKGIVQAKKSPGVKLAELYQRREDGAGAARPSAIFAPPHTDGTPATAEYDPKEGE